MAIPAQTYYFYRLEASPSITFTTRDDKPGRANNRDDESDAFEFMAGVVWTEERR
jgi:hypothetical protein